MKILKISTGYYPAIGFGGATPVMMDIADGLTKRGHSITVYTSNLVDLKSKMSNKSFVRNVRGVAVNYGSSLWNYRGFAVTPDIRRFCLEQMKTFDLVHFYELRSFQVMVGSYYAKKLGVPYVIQTLGSVPNILRSRVKKWVCDQLFTRRILRNAAIGIAKTVMEKEQMVAGGFDPERIVIIPNGYTPPAELAEIRKGHFRKEWHLSPDAQVILYMGRIAKVKGIDILVQAFQRYKGENGYLVIAGNNDDEGYGKRIRNMVSNLKLAKRVIFTGFLEEKKKFESLVDADIFVLPSRQENFPRVILEALSAGLPVVTTSACGLADKIENRVGEIVEPENVSELAKSIEGLLNDPVLRAKYKKEMAGLLQAEFSEEKPILQLEELYLSVINAKKAVIHL